MRDNKLTRANKTTSDTVSILRVAATCALCAVSTLAYNEIPDFFADTKDDAFDSMAVHHDGNAMERESDLIQIVCSERYAGVEAAIDANYRHKEDAQVIKLVKKGDELLDQDFIDGSLCDKDQHLLAYSVDQETLDLTLHLVVS